MKNSEWLIVDIHGIVQYNYILLRSINVRECFSLFTVSIVMVIIIMVMCFAGRVCVPIETGRNMEKVDDFNPFTVPTVKDICEEYIGIKESTSASG